MVCADNSHSRKSGPMQMFSQFNLEETLTLGRLFLANFQPKFSMLQATGKHIPPTDAPLHAVDSFQINEHDLTNLRICALKTLNVQMENMCRNKYEHYKQAHYITSVWNNFVTINLKPDRYIKSQTFRTRNRI